MTTRIKGLEPGHAAPVRRRVFDSDGFTTDLAAALRARKMQADLTGAAPVTWPIPAAADLEPALLHADLPLRTVRLAPGLLVVSDRPGQIRWGAWPPVGVAAAADLSWVLLSVEGVARLVDLRDRDRSS